MESYEEILSRMERRYESESGHSAQDVSDTGLRLRVLAGELYRFSAELEWLRRQAFPQTADGVWLDRHGETRGLARKAARRATGTITFSRYLPLTFDVVIPVGTVCASTGDDPVEYETTEEGVISAGSLTVNVAAQAVIAGTGGNISAGRVNTIAAPPEGVNYVTNKAAFTGGAEAESDEEYRPRVLRAYSQLPNGVNAAYYRDIALSHEKILAAQVVPRENGANTVSVYIWGSSGAPDETLLEEVSALYEDRREIGVTVDVKAASQTTEDVKLRIGVKTGADFATASAAVQSAVRALFATLTVGSAVYLADIQKAALNAAAISELEFPLSMEDIPAAVGVIPVLGSVTVEEIA